MEIEQGIATPRMRWGPRLSTATSVATVVDAHGGFPTSEPPEEKSRDFSSCETHNEESPKALSLWVVLSVCSNRSPQNRRYLCHSGGLSGKRTLAEKRRNPGKRSAVSPPCLLEDRWTPGAVGRPHFGRDQMPRSDEFREQFALRTGLSTQTRVVYPAFFRVIPWDRLGNIHRFGGPQAYPPKQQSRASAQATKAKREGAEGSLRPPLPTAKPIALPRFCQSVKPL